MSISEFHQLVYNFSQTTPSNPAGTNSLTGVMCGLAISFTPKYTGKIMVTVSGQLTNDTSGSKATTGACYGTGTAPINGAAVTGTQMRGIIYQASANNAIGGICQTTYQFTSPLTIGTTYWFDLQQFAVTSGNMAVQSIVFTILEFPL